MANARLDKLNYYDLLKVASGASADDIQRAFHRFARKYHPDRQMADGAAYDKVNRASEVYRRGTEAYRVLSDPVKRRQYDAGLEGGVKRFDPSLPPPAITVATWPVKLRNPAARPFAISS